MSEEEGAREIEIQSSHSPWGVGESTNPSEEGQGGCPLHTVSPSDEGKLSSYPA